jgi:type IV secretion system protein VirD4
MISRILLIASVVVAVCCLFLVFGWWALLSGLLIFRRKPKARSSFGTARWGNASDVNLDSKEGLAIGRLSVSPRSYWAIFNPRMNSRDACMAFWGKRESPAVWLPNVIHAILVAPTGKGKGVSFAIPHGLSCRDNAVYLDINGEIASATASARKQMGHRVVSLGLYPLGTDSLDSLNPLDLIDADSPLAIDDCRALAEALVVRTGQEREPHWCDASEMFFAAILAFLVKHAPPHDRSFQTLRGICANPEELEVTIALMRKSTAWDGMLARMGDQLTHFKDKELGSVMTTCGRFLSFLDSPAVAKSTTTSSFNPKELLTGKMSVFLIVPPEYLRVSVPLIRVWLSTLMLVVVRAGTQNKRLTYFVVDEAGSLSHLTCLDDAIDKYRKFGIRLILMYQSLGQLKKCWPDGGEQTLLANTSQVFWAVQDLPTAEYISNRLGESTIVVESGGTSSGRSRQSGVHGSQGSTSYSVNTNANWSEHNRRLLRPEEVLALDERTAITFCSGLPPLWTTLERYYERKEPRWQRLSAAVMFLQCLILFSVAMLLLMAVLGVNIHGGSR